MMAYLDSFQLVSTSWDHSDHYSSRRIISVESRPMRITSSAMRQVGSLIGFRMEIDSDVDVCADFKRILNQ